MRRDMDLIRQILLEIAEKSTNDSALQIKIEGYSENVISYHVEILAQAGLICATDRSQGPIGTRWFPISLTWDGNDFLDAAGNDTTWNKAKSIVKEKAGTVAFDVLKEILSGIAKGVTGLSQ